MQALKKKTNLFLILGLLLIAVVVCGLVVSRVLGRFGDSPSVRPSERAAVGHEGRMIVEVPHEIDSSVDEAEDSDEKTDDDRAIDAFDARVDVLAEGAEKGEITYEKMKAFADLFRAIPEARQEEELQRALNLVPDENIMYLAAILFDTTFQKERLEQVFQDILNRDEDLKKPILQEIYRNKDHPCWADTAWILDVTDELPKENDAP